MQEPTATSAYPEAVTVWRVDCDFTKCKGNPCCRSSLSFHAPSSLPHSRTGAPQAPRDPTVMAASLPSPAGNRIAVPAQQGGTSGSATGSGNWTCVARRGGTRWLQSPDDTISSRRMPLNELFFFSWGSSNSPDVVVVPRHPESSLEGQWWVNTNLNKSQGST